MRTNMRKASAYSIIALATVLSGANFTAGNCEPEPPANCNRDQCTPCYCLGPTNIVANAPVLPKTCNGDVIVSVAALYWKGDMDGMEYGVKNDVRVDDSMSGNQQMNNLFDAKTLSPNYKHDFGFKLGLGYASPCDGWDYGVTWTWLRTSASNHDEAELDDNQSLAPLWSAYQYRDAGQAPILFVSDIETFWVMKLNLIDFELGRKYWTSKYLSLRPHVGVRVALIDQSFEIQHKGGSFNDPGASPELHLNDEVNLESDFHGVGIRSGLDSAWHLGCGFSLYGNLAASIVYGRFDVEHEEKVRLAVTPFSKTPVLETKNHFRAGRAILDLGLGLQWETMFCDCKYGFLAALGYEQHTFFDQNQFWRVVRVGGSGSALPNNSGQNVHHENSGNLSTSGWTLRFALNF